MDEQFDPYHKWLGIPPEEQPPNYYRLLGVALWNYANGPLDDAQRDKYRPYVTQWGMDPIWKTAGLAYAPEVRHFPDAVASDTGVSLAEASARVSSTQPGRVDVVGFAPQFDATRNLWFADLTIDLSDSPTYSPFVHLALVRYQPHALDDARISTVVTPAGMQIITSGLLRLSGPPAFLMKYFSMASVMS